MLSEQSVSPVRDKPYQTAAAAGNAVTEDNFHHSVQLPSQITMTSLSYRPTHSIESVVRPVVRVTTKIVWAFVMLRSLGAVTTIRFD